MCTPVPSVLEGGTIPSFRKPRCVWGSEQLGALLSAKPRSTSDGLGWRRQQVEMLGWALMANALTMARHRAAEGLEAAA